MLINHNILEALRIISERLKNKVKWVLVGSLSLALQGVEVNAKDIDVLTDKAGAFKINELLKEFEIKKVEFSETKLFRSYFGKFKIKGILVEVMGDLEEKRGNKWHSLSYRLAAPRIIRVSDMEIPVSSLKDQLESYLKSGRKRDSIKIKRIMKAIENI